MAGCSLVVQNAAIAAYVRRRNARAEPKTGFAQDSPIRQWMRYPAKAAWSGHPTSRSTLIAGITTAALGPLLRSTISASPTGHRLGRLDPSRSVPQQHGRGCCVDRHGRQPEITGNTTRPPNRSVSAPPGSAHLPDHDGYGDQESLLERAQSPRSP